MKKGLKIIIAVFIVLILLCALIFFIGYNKRSNMKEPTNISETNSNNEVKPTELGRIIKVNGTLYYDTGKESTALRCGMMDGKIESNVSSNQIPTEDNQSNFEGTYGYQYGMENTIEVNIDQKWYIFKADEASFFGVVKKSEASYILVEPNEGEDERNSSDLIQISLGEYNDAIYPEGVNVKITYNGLIRESYPAQIDATKIELKSTDNFDLKFYDKQPQTTKKLNTILDKSETTMYDYNIYAYEGNVNIVIDGVETSLRNALLENKITMNEIIAKANKDFQNPASYDDGGSIEYHYELYTIIKVHRLDGNRDVYIGKPDLKLNDIL